MKKLLVLLLSGVLLLGFTACGKKSESFSDVIQKQQEQTELLNNVIADMDILMKLEAGGQSQDFTIKATINAENAQDEAAMNFMTDMDMSMLGMDFSTTMYKVGDLVYMDSNGVKTIEDYEGDEAGVNLDFMQMQAETAKKMDGYFTSEIVNGDIVFTSKKDKTKELFKLLYETGNSVMGEDLSGVDSAALFDSPDTKMDGVVQYVFSEDYTLKEMRMDYVMSATEQGQEATVTMEMVVKMNYFETSQLVLPDLTTWGQETGSSGNGSNAEEGLYVYECNSGDFTAISVKVTGDKIDYYQFSMEMSYEELEISESDAALMATVMESLYGSEEGMKINVETDNSRQLLTMHIQLEIDKVTDEQLTMLGMDRSDISVFSDLSYSEFDTAVRTQGCSLK